MGLTYLNGKSWAEVTREERFFCSHLFHLIQRNGINDFVSYLDNKYKASLDSTTYWEIAYEACFYRDFRHHIGNQEKSYSQKRTFDLCLLSEESIVIIEAKSAQEFEYEQTNTFAQDIRKLTELTGVTNVLLAGLKSSKYKKVPDEISKIFNGLILTWEELSEFYGHDQILNRADDIFDNNSISFCKNNLSGHMTGLELFTASSRGEDFYVGRSGGLGGIKLRKDIEGPWKTQRYETNKIVDNQPSSNWFLLSEFIELIKNHQ